MRCHSRQKWLSLFNLIFWKNIRKTKQNLQIYENQNDLQEKQISALTHYLNLTMIQVWEHHRVLLELNAKLLVFNNTLAKTMEALNYLHYMTTVTDMPTTVTSGVFSLKEGVESFYEYM